MHRRACLTLIGLFVAGQSATIANQSAEDAVRIAERDRFAAMVTSDTATLGQLLAAELSYTHGDGRLVDKAAFIADLQSGDFKYLSIQPGDVKVRVLGDTALVTGTAAMQVVNKGDPAQIRVVYTCTHIRRNGSWQLVAWHATRTTQ